MRVICKQISLITEAKLLNFVLTLLPTKASVKTLCVDVFHVFIFGSMKQLQFILVVAIFQFYVLSSHHIRTVHRWILHSQDSLNGDRFIAGLEKFLFNLLVQSRILFKGNQMHSLFFSCEFIKGLWFPFLSQRNDCVETKVDKQTIN